jgi:tripartite-type tricarboxylate transporter receptor subunit TctC
MYHHGFGSGSAGFAAGGVSVATACGRGFRSSAMITKPAVLPGGNSPGGEPAGRATATRSEALPDLPTIGDFVTGYEASTWNGVCAPKNTPADIVDRLNREINAGLADPRLKARLAEMGAWPLPGSPAHCGKLIADEIEKWGKVIRTGNIRPE